MFQRKRRTSPQPWFIVALMGTIIIAGIGLHAGSVHATIQRMASAAAIGPRIGSQSVVTTGVYAPTGIAIDGSGNLYIADTGDNRVVKVTSGGITSTVGTGLNGPQGVAVSITGTVYIADTGNNRVLQVTSGGITSTVGTGLNGPRSVAVSITGTVYIADTTNNRVLQVAPDGTQTGIGSGLSSPRGVTVDGSGNVYIADTSNGRLVKVAAGNGPQTVIGSNNEYSNPSGVAVDASGNVFTTDPGNSHVVEFPTGNGTPLTQGADLISPQGVATDTSGHLYISERTNNRVVKTTIVGPVTSTCPSGTLPAGSGIACTSITSAGPLSEVHIGTDLSCQVALTGDYTTTNHTGTFEYYPTDLALGDCGTFIRIGTTLYGPDFDNHNFNDDTAATGLGPMSPYTQVSQSAVTGAGTRANPYKIVTVAAAGTTGIQLTQTDSYVVGNSYYRTDIMVANTNSATQSVSLSHAADCYLAGSDQGFGRYDATARSAQCTSTQTPSARIETFQDLSGGATYDIDKYNTIWTVVEQQTPFTNSIKTDNAGSAYDNGGGLSYALTIPGNGSTTVSLGKAFGVGTGPIATDTPTSTTTPTSSATNTPTATPTATKTNTPTPTLTVTPTPQSTRVTQPLSLHVSNGGDHDSSVFTMGPATLAFKGSGGFTPLSSVSIHVVPAGSTTPLTTFSTQAAADGTLPETTVVKLSIPGVYVATATDGATGRIAQTTFVVLRPASVVTAPAIQYFAEGYTGLSADQRVGKFSDTAGTSGAATYKTQFALVNTSSFTENSTVTYLIETAGNGVSVAQAPSTVVMVRHVVPAHSTLLFDAAGDIASTKVASGPNTGHTIVGFNRRIGVIVTSPTIAGRAVIVAERIIERRAARTGTYLTGAVSFGVVPLTTFSLTVSPDKKTSQSYLQLLNPSAGSPCVVTLTQDGKTVAHYTLDPWQRITVNLTRMPRVAFAHSPVHLLVRSVDGKVVAEQVTYSGPGYGSLRASETVVTGSSR